MALIAICIVTFIFLVLVATISFQLEVIIDQLKKINDRKCCDDVDGMLDEAIKSERLGGGAMSSMPENFRPH